MKKFKKVNSQNNAKKVEVQICKVRQIADIIDH